MPRLNHGTLLENLVVLEVVRVLTRRPEATVEFACSFAMPPLTLYWHRTPHEPTNNPRFNADVMANLLNGTFAVGSRTSDSVSLARLSRERPRPPRRALRINGRCTSLRVRRSERCAVGCTAHDEAGPVHSDLVQRPHGQSDPLPRSPSARCVNRMHAHYPVLCRALTSQRRYDWSRFILWPKIPGQYSGDGSVVRQMRNSDRVPRPRLVRCRGNSLTRPGKQLRPLSVADQPSRRC